MGQELREGRRVIEGVLRREGWPELEARGQWRGFASTPAVEIVGTAFTFLELFLSLVSASNIGESR